MKGIYLQMSRNEMEDKSILEQHYVVRINPVQDNGRIGKGQEPMIFSAWLREGIVVPHPGELVEFDLDVTIKDGKVKPVVRELKYCNAKLNQVLTDNTK